MKQVRLCIICEFPLNYPNALYCKRCKRLLDRVDTRRNPNRAARVRALQESWDGKDFRCYYTSIRLVEDDSKSPTYLTFDHFTPRQEDRIVIVAQLINDMKSDMSDREFRAMVMELAKHFNGGEFNEKVFKLKHWKR